MDSLLRGAAKRLTRESLCLGDKPPLLLLLKEGCPGSCDRLWEPACRRGVCFPEPRGLLAVSRSMPATLSWLMT